MEAIKRDVVHREENWGKKDRDTRERTEKEKTAETGA